MQAYCKKNSMTFDPNIGKNLWNKKQYDTCPSGCIVATGFKMVFLVIILLTKMSILIEMQLNSY